MPCSLEVDFAVFKALTALRRSEHDSYNDVLRRELKLGPAGSDVLPPEVDGCWFSDVFFPDGSRFRVTYKGQTYQAEIVNGHWVDENGQQRRSPSDAASAITSTNVNGWRFWFVKRPIDQQWQRLDRVRGLPNWRTKLNDPSI